MMMTTNNLMQCSTQEQQNQQQQQQQKQQQQQQEYLCAVALELLDLNNAAASLIYAGKYEEAIPILGRGLTTFRTNPTVLLMSDVVSGNCYETTVEEFMLIAGNDNVVAAAASAAAAAPCVAAAAANKKKKSIAAGLDSLMEYPPQDHYQRQCMMESGSGSATTSGNGGVLSSSSSLPAYCYPITIPTRGGGKEEQEGEENESFIYDGITVASSIVFNLALAHQMLAAMTTTSTSTTSNSMSPLDNVATAYGTRKVLLSKAVKLYEYSFDISTRRPGQQQSQCNNGNNNNNSNKSNLLFRLVAVSNVGKCHEVMGQMEQSRQCYQFLLSMILQMEEQQFNNHSSTAATAASFDDNNNNNNNNHLINTTIWVEWLTGHVLFALLGSDFSYGTLKTAPAA